MNYFNFTSFLIPCGGHCSYSACYDGLWYDANPRPNVREADTLTTKPTQHGQTRTTYCSCGTIPDPSAGVEGVIGVMGPPGVCGVNKLPSVPVITGLLGIDPGSVMGIDPGVGIWSGVATEPTLPAAKVMDVGAIGENSEDCKVK